jgi:hypothetical protein
VLAEPPCLWCWEIRDEVSGELVENSWTAEWLAYLSQEEALEAGEARLAELMLRKRTAKAQAVRGRAARIGRYESAGRAS